MPNKRIINEFLALQKNYTGLILEENNDNNSYTIKGRLFFDATYNGVEINECFDIKIFISPQYPEEIPSVWETTGRIPNKFHKLKNKSLCLGAPINVSTKFHENSSLLGFLNNLVIPYLFSFSYFEKHGRMPYGEQFHGGKGILENYKKIFNISDEVTVLYFLKIMAENSYKNNRYKNCPCGSNKKLCYCHGEHLRRIMSFQRRNRFFYEFREAYLFCININICLPDYLYGKEIQKMDEKYIEHLKTRSSLNSFNKTRS